jgi:hypothetical protein
MRDVGDVKEPTAMAAQAPKSGRGGARAPILKTPAAAQVVTEKCAESFAEIRHQRQGETSPKRQIHEKVCVWGANFFRNGGHW